ncbi:tubulin-specific chaperone-like protein E [Byssothecium circinans]|uniref:Tubulin-specific chaperone-like protein E n=1 Tax=Byssothecium circinans TaxID=147558 RepID=A0A6A5TTX1_9PLEO|nr:tubulin-specific chaperone-like protein E [Byssothecium circinans]
MTTDIYVGKRLSFDGQLCTVRYHGEVKGTKGEWLGVEWDDPTRGKHSGEHAGTRYFECLRKEAQSASFIRPSRKPDPSRSFVEALKAKYASEAYDDPDVKIVFHVAAQKGDHEKLQSEESVKMKQKRSVRISGKEVEEVGFDKIRKKLAALSELKIVILDGLCMERPVARAREGRNAWPAGLTDVKDACPKATELDLSRNLFEEWREIASICEQLDNLKGLRVEYEPHDSSQLCDASTADIHYSGTRLRDTSLTDTEVARCQRAFANIKILKLESTLLPWADLTRLTHLFPSLTALVASQNLYNSLPSFHSPTSTITELSLEENLLTSLCSLQPLMSLPNLRRLILKSNNISTITSSPTSPTPIFSESVKEVDLSYNEITTWSFIDGLQNAFPGLTSLRISHNPLFSTLHSFDGRPLTPEDGYMLVLARLPSITTLNFSPVLPKERLNAESYYLSLIAKELSFAPKAEEEKILKSHPRWEELCEEYGEPVVTRADGVNPNSLAARLIKLKVYEKEGGKSRDIEVPKSATAYTLLGVVCREFRAKPRACKLVWETGDWMFAAKEVVDDEEDWTSGSESDEGEEKVKPNSVMREVEIVPGTRSIGTLVEGSEAIVRLEVK